MNKVALYIRVSTGKQAKEGDSLEAQENALKDYCKEHKYKIVETYIDGGESGQKLSRTNLQRMLNDCEKKEFNLILMTKLDRWFRNVSDFYKVLDILDKYKIDWKTIWEDYDTTSATGKFWLNISLSLGQMEAQRTSERIREVFDYKMNVAKQVCSGTKIFGYDIVDKKLVPNKEDIEILNKIFDKYLECNSIYETTRWYIENYKTVDPVTIKKYLTNTAYIGKYKKYRSDVYIENFSPKIIDEEKFNKVQELIKKNVKKSTSKKNTFYIFSGLIRCSRCGYKYCAVNKEGYKYYRCRKNSQGLCKGGHIVVEKKLEDYLLNNIDKYIEEEHQKQMDNEIKIKEKEKNDNTNKLNTLKTKKDKLVDLYLNELIDKEKYESEFIKLEEEIKLLSINKINNNKVDFSNHIKIINSNWKELYNKFNDKEKRELWLSLIKEIHLSSYDDIKLLF